MIPAATVYKMLGNQTLWEIAIRCNQALVDAKVPYSVAGGVAVCLHGYQRNTVDLDLLVDGNDAQTIRDALTAVGFTWNDELKQFETAAGIPVQFLLKGEKAGPDSEVCFPDPADKKSVTRIDGLPVLSLAKLIEVKIACGQGSLRRTHRDFADVVELIAKHDLSRSFARFLHKSVRKTFRELVLRVRGGR